jgi:2-hydroxy-6-oxonona-2,4-dienedioate hydrolase
VKSVLFLDVSKACCLMVQRVSNMFTTTTNVAKVIDRDSSMEPRIGTLERTWTDVQGFPIHARVSVDPVPPDAPIVVLVHGSGLSGRYMLPTAERLAPHYHVYMPDLPGFGDSGKPSRVLTVSELADALASWMETTGVDRPGLLGNSFGCQVIAELAVRHPERVERAVLQGPTTPSDERSWFWQFVRWRQNQRYNPRSLGPITYGDYRKCGLRRMFWSFQYQLKDRIEDKLARIQAPLLIVRGSEDPICNQRWCEELTRLAPCGRLVVIPGVAHTLVYTAPVELVRVTRPFFNEVRRDLK